MSVNIEKIFYINLERRTDRRNDFEQEMFGRDLSYERFDAIEHIVGCVGCSLSHLSVVKLARERGYKNVLIFEDDFQFTVDKETFEKQLSSFFTSNIDYNVYMLNYTSEQTEAIENQDFFRRITFGNTTSCYLVHCNYYDTLINLWEWAHPLLLETRHHWIFACDQIWEQLQKHDQWYCCYPAIGKQRDGVSDT